MKSKILFVWMCLTLGAVLGLAQSEHGTLTGTITDTSGASVPGAAVVATNPQNGAKYQTQSSPEGVFTLAELPYGSYDVTITKDGFQTAQSKGVVIGVNQVTRLNSQMQLGQSQQTVEVSAQAPLLQADSSTVQSNFSTRQILELPLAIGAVGNARSPETFTFLTPGVAGDTFRTRVNGGQQFSNEVLVDGTSTTRDENGPAFDETAPSIEAFGEFSIKTNNFAAEYGATGSSITSFAYKSGTNGFHGDAYEFLRNTALDSAGFYDTGNCSIGGKNLNANDFCTDSAHAGSRTRRPGLDNRNDYGFTLGGPVWIPKIYDGHNKTFFFFSYEGYRQGLTFRASPQHYPTARELGGDFGELLGLKSPVLIYDPQTGQPFANNVIPQSRFSSVSQYSLPFFPKPNFVDPSNGLTDLYINGVATVNRSNLYTTVIDHTLNDKQHLHYSYSTRNNFRTRDPSNLLPGSNPLTQLRQQNFTTYYHRGSWDYTLTPTLLNHLNLGFNRTFSKNGTVTAGSNFVANSGLKGVANTHTPTLSLPGYPDFGNSELNRNIDNSYQIAENMSWVRGRHTFKFGTDIHRLLYDPKTQNNGAGHFIFGPQLTGNPNDGSGGDAFASYLLGAVSHVDFNLNLVNPGWRRLYDGSFFQDDFKVNSKLTLNYGLRYDFEIPRSEVVNRTSSLDPFLQNPAAGNIAGALGFARPGHTHFERTFWKDLGPRLGLSYALNQKTILHGGYGIYYNQLFYSDFGEHTKQGFDASPNFDSPNGKAPAFYWQNGVPQTFSRPPFTDPSGINTQNIDYLSPDSKPPYVQSWNVGVERELTSTMKASVSYVANKGTRLYRGFDIEQLKPKYMALGDLLGKNINDPAVVAAGFKSPYPGFSNDWGGGATLARSLRLYPQYSGVNYINNTDGNSTYNSLQAQLEKRFSSGLQFLVSYTYSKSLTDADSQLPFTAFAFTQNDYNTKAEKSVSSDDLPQTLAISYLYELPFGKGKPLLNREGVVNKLVGGWEVSGIMQYASGAPLQLGAFCPSISNNFGGGCRPNLVSGQKLLGPGASGHPDPNNGKPYLNAAAFSIPAPYTYGNTARLLSNARGFGNRNENIALFKNTSVFGEKLGTQFRLEVFNLFNRTIFNGPDTFIGGFDPSQPNNLGANGHFGTFGGQANTPRVIQFGLKLLF